MKKSFSMPQEPIIIKKYENRRLYDTVNSRYVNLEDVARLLQSEHHVKVIDAATNEDITRLILTQIIVEDAKGPDSIFPISVLRDMVIASGRASQEGALKYMRSMMDLYQKTYQVIAPPVPSFDFRRPGRPPAEPVQAQAPAPAAPGSSDTDDLKQRVAELESLVARMAPAKSRPKRRKADR